MAGDPGRGLRPYQSEAVAAVTAGLRGGGRGQLHAACGTGKTRMAAEAAARLVRDGVIVVLAPSIALTAQTLEAWPAGCPVDAAFAVCSDATVGGTGMSGRVVPASTDAEVIAKWLVSATGRVLVTATYDSAGRLDEALRLAGRQAELVVCDEAHVTAGRADKLAAAVLDDGFVPAGRRLFMTATPRVVTGVRAGGELTVASMDDERVYGPVLYRYPFAAGIRDGYLKDYRLLVAAVGDADARELLADPRLAEDGVPVTMAAAQAALAIAAVSYGLRRCVVFVPRVADARLFARTLPRVLDLLPPGRRPAGPVSAGLVSGEMSAAQRDRELARLRNPPAGGWSVVTNARCLGEGIDIPAIDSVMFAAPKESVTDIAQATGRALRPHSDAATATVIVPALLPASHGHDGQQPDAAGGRWDHVLNVVRALGAHDESLADELSQARARRAGRPGQPDRADLPGRIIVEAPPGTVARTLEALCIRIVDGTTSAWWTGYGHARAWHAEHGDLDVPSGHVIASGFRLGSWMSWQRNSRNRGKLSPERIRLLDALGITWDQAEAAWLRAYAELCTFQDQHGHCEVPVGHQTSEGALLVHWCRHQRQAARAGTLSGGHRDLLEAIGFPWDAGEARWMRRYQQLVAAIARYGSVQDLPRDCPEAAWLQGQYNNNFRRGKLADRQLALLAEAGVRLGPYDPWADFCQALADLRARNGNLRIPAGTRTPGGLKLANLASRARARWNAGQLTAGQVRQLEDLGFARDPGSDQWNARYAELRAWAAGHEGFTFPAAHPLRDWLYEQRKRQAAGTLPAGRAGLLVGLGAIHDPGTPPGQTPAGSRHQAGQPQEAGNGDLLPDGSGTVTSSTRLRQVHGAAERPRQPPACLPGPRDLASSFTPSACPAGGGTMSDRAAAGGLRRYQADAVAAITAGLGRGGRGQLRAACGTGKTRIASAAAAELAGDGVTVVLVPSIALAAQTITGWHSGGLPDRVLAVCSDHTVGDGGRAADLPVPVTTDTEEIAKWVIDAPPGSLIVGTYDSAARLAEGLRRAGITAELTVCDEAHRLAGAAGKPTAAILKPGVLPDRRRLFMTATPRICTGTKADGSVRTVSMDDEDVFGPVLYRYPFRRAISDGWLKEYRIVIATVTSRQVAEVLDGNSELTGDGDVPVRMAAAQAAAAMAAAEFGLRRCVAFVSRVADARRFASSLPATLGMLPAGRRPPGPVSAGHVHGRMSSIQRDLTLDRLRIPPDGGWSVVANARCLGEGVDIPAIDSVLFGAPKESVTDIVQAVGRALRRHDDADTATIIVPALIPDDDGSTTGPDVAGSRYENVLRVIRALCAHDEDLTAALEALRAGRAADPADEPPDLPSQITVLGPPGVLQATLDALRIQVLTRATSSWWDGYGHARAYYDAHGNLDVSVPYVTGDGYPLGTWLTGQRADRNRGSMPPDRARLLDQAGMIWDRLETAWMAAYRELSAFNDRHGHFEVPVDYLTADGIKLNDWQKVQRDADRAGKLTSQRRALLETIGFPFDPSEARWMRRYQLLTDALTRHGGPVSLPPGSPEATWLEGQHLAHHHGKLPEPKIALLEQAGITIRRPGTDPWMAAYQDIVAFKTRHGHLRIPAGCTDEAGIDLSDWQRGQRVRRKDGRMTSEQERLLTEAGFCWDPAADAWNARYLEAADWKQHHGTLDLPRRHPVSEWLYRQQKLHDNGRLPAGRVTRLKELGALTDAPAETAEEPQ